MIRISYRRHDVWLALSLVAMVAIALNIWFNIVAKPETIDEYLWLARLHEPATQGRERVARALYPIVGYPRNVRFAVTGAYAVLVGIWTFIALAVVVFCRTISSMLKSATGGQ